MDKAVCFGVIAMMTLAASVAVTYQSYGWVDPNPDKVDKKAPTVVTGDNVYVVWFTDKGMPNSNGEVIFRASTDKGQTFGDKINLSNTTDADSIDAQIDADGSNVVITWWERNQADDIPVMRISNDNGKTFGPLLKLGANGTIGGE